MSWKYIQQDIINTLAATTKLWTEMTNRKTHE